MFKSSMCRRFKQRCQQDEIISSCDPMIPISDHSWCENKKWFYWLFFVARHNDPTGFHFSKGGGLSSFSRAPVLMGIAVLWRCLLMPGTRHDVFAARERVGLRMGLHFRMSSYHSWMGGMFLRPTVGTRFCMADELSRFEIEATLSD